MACKLSAERVWAIPVIEFVGSRAKAGLGNGVNGCHESLYKEVDCVMLAIRTRSRINY